MKLNEFYLERQGHPDSKVNLDMESRRPNIPTGHVTWGLLSAALQSLLVTHSDVDDTPVDGATTMPISSNWAHDHADEQEEDLYLNDLRVMAILGAMCGGVDWSEFDWETTSPDDVMELAIEGLNRFLDRSGGTLTGQLKLSGNAITYDDLMTPINSLKLSGTKPPTWTSYKSGEVLAFSDQALDSNEEIVFFQLQMPHNYKEGTDISIHIHYVPEDNTGGDVYWMLTYSWASIDTAFPTATTIYMAASCGTVTDAHRLAEFADVHGGPAGVKKLISSMLICKLQRRSSNALDTYTGKSVYLLEVDVHYQVDSLGSSQRLVK